MTHTTLQRGRFAVGAAKWPTDPPLRAGTAASHVGTDTDTQYDSLAGVVAEQVNAIVANCKLPPEADANLHYAIDDLTVGARADAQPGPGAARHRGVPGSWR